MISSRNRRNYLKYTLICLSFFILVSPAAGIIKEDTLQATQPEGGLIDHQTDRNADYTVNTDKQSTTSDFSYENIAEDGLSSPNYRQTEVQGQGLGSEFDYYSTKPTSQNHQAPTSFKTHSDYSFGLSLDAVYAEFDPISITSNGDFATQATNNGWAGDGSMATPYIIEGYDINGTSGVNPIYITGTTVYFEIKNNLIRDAVTANGILLVNVANAVVSNNEIYNIVNYGIAFNGADSEISNNYIHDVTWSAVYVYGGVGTSNVSIYNNTISQNLSNGVYVYQVGSGITIKANFIIDSGNSGVNVDTTDGVTTHNNTLSYNRDGIYYASSLNGIITENIAQYNDRYGMYLVYSDNILVNNNIVLDSSYVENNGFGIYLYGISGGTVSGNEVGRNHDGMNIQYCDNMEFSKNFVYGSKYSGIATIYSTSLLNIFENILTNNTSNGLYLNQLSSSNIHHNQAFDNGDNGIVGIRGGSNTYEYNNVTENFGSGIRLIESVDNTIQHNVFNNDGFQIMGLLYEHYKQTVFDNNTANGAPILFIEDTFTSLPAEFAQIIFLNITGMSITGKSYDNLEIPFAFAFCSGITFENNVISHSTGSGITFHHTNNSIIRGNTIDFSRWDAVDFTYSGINNVIENNELYNSTYRGILLADVDFTLVTGNDIHNNEHDDLAIVRSHNTTITDNIVHDGGSRFGVIFDAAQNSTFIGNQVFNHDTDGVKYFQGSHNSIISSLSATHNTWSGMYIENSDNFTITDSDFSNNIGYGVRSYLSDNIVYDHNTATNNGIHGFNGDLSSDITLRNNYAYNNTEYGIAVSRITWSVIINNTSNYNMKDGITVWSSSHNATISENTAIGNKRVGIWTQSSIYNNITDNIVEDSGQHGIYIDYSYQNNIIRNKLRNTGLYVIGSTVDNILQAQVANNTVNGKPLVFIQQKHDGTWVEDAGQVVIIDSSKVFIEGLDLSNTTTGALVRHSNKITFSGNIVGNTSYYGIILNQGTNNSIVVGNSFFQNGLGFRITSQAVDHGWDNYFGYNYWENGSLVDVNFDGISEVPYLIDGDSDNRDETPLTVAYSVVFVEVLNNDSLSDDEKAGFFADIPPEVLYGGGGLAFLGLGGGGTFAYLRKRRRKPKT